MATGTIKYFEPIAALVSSSRTKAAPKFSCTFEVCADGISKLLADQRVRFREQPSRRQAGKIEAVDVALRDKAGSD
jgi:hypothetical protein